MVLLLPLLLLPLTRKGIGASFYHSIIVVVEKPGGTVTLTKWERYERRK